MSTREEKGKAPSRNHNSKDAGSKAKKDFKKKPYDAKKRSQKDKQTPFGGERPSGIQGASKLKASIRQTKRLLAKDTLAPGVRIEADRRLIALEQDLEKLEQFKLEKTRAAKYHGVKFFERQKLVRKIKKVKRQLDTLRRRAQGEDVDSEQESDGEVGSNSSEPRLQEMLTTYRQLLHYVLQYPSDVKYVALFPDGTSEPKLPVASDSDKTNQRAHQHLNYVSNAMKESKLSTEPEIELELGDRAKKVSHSSAGQTLNKRPANKKGSKSQDSDSGLKGDDFFDQASSDEE